MKKYDLYPVTIVQDRYNRGFVAFALQACDVPEEIDGGDNENFGFYGYPEVKEYVGIGLTPNDALTDLFDKFNSHTDDYDEYESLTKFIVGCAIRGL